MEIGIHTENFQDLKINRKDRDALMKAAYEEIRAAGFDGADLTALADVTGPYYTADLATAREMAKKERAVAEAAGLHIYQVHGPWPTDDKTAENRKNKLVHMERAIRLTRYFGARYLVIHPDMPFGWGDEPDPSFARETNTEMLRALLPIAAEEDVVLCLENMPMKSHALSRTKTMYEFVREFDHPNLGMCLDTGHANVFGDDCGEAVRLIAPVLKTLHVHDNMGDKDSHLPPFKGTINWKSFTDALKDIGFDGVLSIEAVLEVRDMKDPHHAEAARRMAEIARTLAD